METFRYILIGGPLLAAIVHYIDQRSISRAIINGLIVFAVLLAVYVVYPIFP